jgi:hypothetical protein
MLGVGAPTARQVMVASLPSRTVTFWGGNSITGMAAVRIHHFLIWTATVQVLHKVFHITF